MPHRPPGDAAGGPPRARVPDGGCARTTTVFACTTAGSWRWLFPAPPTMDVTDTGWSALPVCRRCVTEGVPAHVRQRPSVSHCGELLVAGLVDHDDRIVMGLVAGIDDIHQRPVAPGRRSLRMTWTRMRRTFVRGLGRAPVGRVHLGQRCLGARLGRVADGDGRWLLSVRRAQLPSGTAGRSGQRPGRRVARSWPVRRPGLTRTAS